jgi:hypothetical protein
MPEQADLMIVIAACPVLLRSCNAASQEKPVLQDIPGSGIYPGQVMGSGRQFEASNYFGIYFCF